MEVGTGHDKESTEDERMELVDQVLEEPKSTLPDIEEEKEALN